MRYLACFVQKLGLLQHNRLQASKTFLLQNQNLCVLAKILIYDMGYLPCLLQKLGLLQHYRYFFGAQAIVQRVLLRLTPFFHQSMQNEKLYSDTKIGNRSCDPVQRCAKNVSSKQNIFMTESKSLCSCDHFHI